MMDKHSDPKNADIQRLEAKVDQLTELVGQLVERNQRQSELIDEAMPIAKEMMDWATVKLDKADKAGVFALGREGLGVLEAVVEAYEPEDLRALSQSVVTILEGVRSITQPEVMALLAEAGEAIQHGDELAPVTPLEVLKAGRDPEVQRGMAVMVEVLRQVGRATKTMHPLHAQDDAKERRQRLLAKRLAPTGTRTAPAAPRTAPRVRPAPSAARMDNDTGSESTENPGMVASVAQRMPSPATPEHWEITGYVLDAQGYLSDPNTWTEEFANCMAEALGAPELEHSHWEVLHFARACFLKTGRSPNIRAITVGMGISTKELYDLWPVAPGTTTARISGLPKPTGCI